jgi:hypothetical protein
MHKTLPYTAQSIQMIFDNLKNLQNQGITKDFEVRVDDLTTVHRTSDLSKFSCYENALSENTNKVCFLLYKGHSRRYDKYDLLLKKQVNSQTDFKNQQYIEQRVAEALELYQQQTRLATLVEETKTQKKIIEKLESKISELESKNKNEMSALLQLAKNFLPSPSPETIGKELNGVPSGELAEMIGYYRKEFGEEVFSKAMGIALQVAKQPELITEVNAFINQKMRNDG